MDDFIDNLPVVFQDMEFFEKMHPETVQNIREICAKLAVSASATNAASDVRLSQATKSYFSRLKTGGADFCKNEAFSSVIGLLYSALNGRRDDLQRASCDEIFETAECPESLQSYYASSQSVSINGQTSSEQTSIKLPCIKSKTDGEIYGAPPYILDGRDERLLTACFNYFAAKVMPQGNWKRLSLDAGAGMAVAEIRPSPLKPAGALDSRTPRFIPEPRATVCGYNFDSCRLESCTTNVLGRGANSFASDTQGTPVYADALELCKDVTTLCSEISNNFAFMQWHENDWTAKCREMQERLKQLRGW